MPLRARHELRLIAVRRGGEWPHRDALPALAPSAVGVLELSGAWRSAALAPTLSCQIPSRELVPIAPDQRCLAAVTVRTLALWIANIAGVDVAQPGLRSDAERHAQRSGRRRRRLQHLPVR